MSKKLEINMRHMSHKFKNDFTLIKRNTDKVEFWIIEVSAVWKYFLFLYTDITCLALDLLITNFIFSSAQFKAKTVNLL